MIIMKFTPILSLRSLLCLVVITMSVFACSPSDVEDTITVTPTVVKLTAVTAIDNGNTFRFPATVSAVKTIEVRFEVTGRLVKLDMPTGSVVKAGQLLAMIDPVPFERKVLEKQTKLTQAQRELSRVESMFVKKLVSQSSMDDAKTALELADIELSNAQQDLSYTKLYAPFNAQISQRYVENDSYVSAGESIAKLQDVSQMYFHFSVPERIFTANARRDIANAQIAIIGASEQWYDVRYVEHAAEPHPISQTYDVVFALAQQDELVATPGARAVAKVTLKSQSNQFGMSVPMNALVGDNQAGFYVWRFNENDGSLTKLAVTVVSIKNEFALVSKGVAVGDLLVSAGAAKMYDGIIVKPFTGVR
jgi:RND family efflux transporter MFP subunit